MEHVAHNMEQGDKSCLHVPCFMIRAPCYIISSPEKIQSRKII
ncbi:MAG: hypothetical protein V4467_00750 [Patescibacteria group bacterium]